MPRSVRPARRRAPRPAEAARRARRRRRRRSRAQRARSAPARRRPLVGAHGRTGEDGEAELGAHLEEAGLAVRRDQRVDLFDLGQDVEELSSRSSCRRRAPSARRPPRSWRRRARSAPAPGRPSCAGHRAGVAPRRRSAAGCPSPARSGCRWRPPPACPPRAGPTTSRGSSTSSIRSGPLARSGTVAMTQPDRQPSSPATRVSGSATAAGPPAQASRARLTWSCGVSVTFRPISSSTSASARAAAPPSSSA